MNTGRTVGWMASWVSLLALTPNAHAQFAVVDVGAIAQLVQQVQTMQEQLTTARDQLTQTQEEFQSMTGGRGMERLLAGLPRNYLPAQWRELAAVLDQASTTYGLIAGEMQRVITANSVLTAEELARLSAADRALLESSRRSKAMLQVITREALDRTGSRFGSIQQLIDAIGGAGDQKAVLDLQARIQAESNMLLNENTKLQVLYQLAQAEEAARTQRTREQAIEALGSLRDLPPMGLQ